MTRDVAIASPGMSIQQAAQEMAARNIGSLPVFDEPHPVGVVTDRDITLRGVALGLPPETPVREVMTPGLDSIADYQTLEDAADLMRKKQIRRVYVLDQDNWIVGVVSLSDLARAADDPRLSGDVLKQISSPTVLHS